jgi:hypothetical protein
LSFVNGDGGRQERACCLADDDDDAPAVYFLLLFWGLVRNIILGLSTWLAGRPLAFQRGVSMVLRQFLILASFVIWIPCSLFRAGSLSLCRSR